MTNRDGARRKLPITLAFAGLVCGVVAFIVRDAASGYFHRALDGSDVVRSDAWLADHRLWLGAAAAFLLSAAATAYASRSR